MKRAYGNHYRPGTAQSQAVGVASAAATAVGDQTYVVRLVSTTNCHIAIDTAATATDTYLPANVPEVFTIRPGEAINVIRNSADGTLYITELTQ